MIVMEAITLEEKYDEYDFLIKHICEGKSTKELCDLASEEEEELNQKKVASIIDYLLLNQYVTTFEHPSLHDPNRFGETPIKIFDNHTCREIKELLKQKNLI